MRKVLTVTVFAALLCGLMLSGCSCENGKVDWKQVSEKAITFALTELVIPAYEKFHGEKTSIVDKVMEQINASTALAPYVKYVDVKTLVEKIFDVVDKNWHDVLFKAGADVEGVETELPIVYEYNINALLFPDIFDIEVK